MGVLYGCAYARYVRQSVWDGGAKDGCTGCSCAVVMAIIAWAVMPRHLSFVLSLGRCGWSVGWMVLGCVRRVSVRVYVGRSGLFLLGIGGRFSGVYGRAYADGTRARKSPLVIKSYEQGGFEMDRGGLSAVRLTRNNPSPSDSGRGRQIRWRLLDPAVCRH